MASAVGPRVASSCAHESLVVLSADDRLVCVMITIHFLTLCSSFHSTSFLYILWIFLKLFNLSRLKSDGVQGKDPSLIDGKAVT